MPIEIESVKAEHLQTNRWLLYSRTAVDLTRSCPSEILHYTIYGTYVLTIDDSCEYKIADYSFRKHTFDGEQITYPKLPLITWPDNLKMEPPIPVEPIKISGVDLTNLKMLSYALKNSEEHGYENVVNTESVSIGTILLYIIVVIIILTFILIKYRTKQKNVRKDQNLPKENPSDDFELKEGGVTLSVPYRNRRIINVAAPQSASSV
ncbi:hypothetical protein O0L34_g4995 [Tuta absoluta]|nr:hypothetical protein O0L34_g14672 [Tuta absoluta]KAJ2945926.1 hypothetical protein O0L34_g4841 [Tuta absoluta]KAJ2946076.1 hypothetical protein O0L34_g4995 [Tuta absoluta]